MTGTPAPSEVTVVHLGPDAAKAAGRLLARAFQDDPIKVAMMPDTELRDRLAPGMFTARVVSVMASGGQLTGTSDGGGAALWMAPGVELRISSMLSSFLATPGTMLRTPPAVMRAGMTFGQQLKKRRDDLMPEPHWYLATLGVAPSRQGRGLGSLLVRDGLRLADQDGARTYLETETEDDVRFYSRFGFTVLEQITAGGVDVPMWLMAREPRPAQAPS